MKEAKDAVKARVKAKKAKIKAKVKTRAKSRKAKAAVAVALAALCTVLAGCMDTNPASRSNDNRVGDIEPYAKVVIGENACSNTVNVTIETTLGDGLVASADSTGSTETQTATPTLDVRTRVDARYNDALAGATAASKDVLGQIGDGATAVLDLMQSKESGTVKVTKTDGTEATVECKDGQCSFCTDTDGAAAAK